MADSFMEELKSTLVGCGFRVHDNGERDGWIDWELEGLTDADGDMIHQIRVPNGRKGDPAAWEREFYDMVDDFDPWEEALKWCDETGRPQKTPFDSGSDLYNDILAYKTHVLEPMLEKAFGDSSL